MPIVTAAPLVVSEEQRAELTRLAASSVLAHRQVVQARALLWAADGLANEEIARRSGVDSDTVRRWRKRFLDRGIGGVGVIAKGRGRKSWLPPGTVAEVLRLTREELPADGSTHWTTRTLAARVGIGKDSVAKIWADHNLKPWRVETYKVSNDPRFEDKLVDVVGLYLNPPMRAALIKRVHRRGHAGSLVRSRWAVRRRWSACAAGSSATATRRASECRRSGG
jgi:transposase